MRPSLGRYTLLRAVGAGAFGEVWQVRDEGGEQVALKILRRTLRDAASLQREIRAVSRLCHPHVIPLYDVGIVEGSVARQLEVPEGSPWLVTAWAPGGSLEGCRLPLAEARLLLLDVLDALGHAHAHGVWHLDVKPANVLRAPGGGAWLADFGVARLSGEHSREIAGSPPYMAPEQLAGSPSASSDLYALGCLAWALVSGAPPLITEGSTADWARLHAREAPIPPGDWPEPFARWVLRLLAKHPRDRFQHPRDARLALADLRLEPSAQAAPRIPVIAPTWSDTLDLPDALHELLPALERTTEVPQEEAPPLPEDWREGTPLQWSWARWIQARRLRGDPALFGLLSHPTMGQLQQRDALWHALRQAEATARPGLVVLVGPRGVGTSHLAGWIARRAAELGGAPPRWIRTPDALRRVARARPGVWVADAPDDLLLGELQRWLPDATGSLLIVATLRWEALHRAGALLALPQASLIELAPLHHGDLLTLVTNLVSLDEDTAAELTSACHGNPGLALRTLRGWIEDDLLEHGPRGHRPRGGVVVPADEAAVRLIEALLGDDRRAWGWLRAVGALPDRIPLSVWDRLAGPDATPLLDALVAHGLAQRGASTRGEAQWHPVWPAAGPLAPDDEALQSALSAWPDGPDGWRGDLLLRLGRPTEALDALVQAAHRPLSDPDVHPYSVAEHLIDALSAARVPPDDPRWGSAHLYLALLLHMDRDPGAAEHDRWLIQRATGQRPDLRAAVSLSEGRQAVIAGQFRRAHARLDQALIDARASGRPWLIGRAVYGRLIHAGADAAGIAAEGAAAFEAAGQPGWAGMVWDAEAQRCLVSGDRAGGWIAAERALSCFARDPVPAEAALALATRGELALALGRAGAARRDLDQAEAELERLGNVRILWVRLLQGFVALAGRASAVERFEGLISALDTIFQGPGLYPMLARIGLIQARLIDDRPEGVPALIDEISAWIEDTPQLLVPRVRMALGALLAQAPGIAPRLERLLTATTTRRDPATPEPR